MEPLTLINYLLCLLIVVYFFYTQILGHVQTKACDLWFFLAAFASANIGLSQSIDWLDTTLFIFLSFASAAAYGSTKTVIMVEECFAEDDHERSL